MGHENVYAKPVTLGNILKFAVPTIAMTVFMSFYTMVDGLFVSNLIGTDALSAINLTAPVIQLVTAVSAMLATGGSAVIMKKMGEQRNREAMEEKGYTEESYEAWRDDAAEDMGIADTGQPDMDDLLEKEMLLGVLEEALDSLMPEERELALKVFGEQVPVSEFAKERGEPRTTVSSRKVSVLGKLRAYFRGKGLDV